MRKMTVEEAIKRINESQEWIIKNLQVSDAIIILLRVAEAWVRLYKDTATDGPLRQIMDRFLNPAPKTDIERVREWAKGQRIEIEGAPWNIVELFKLLDFLDQLEKEKR